MKKTVFKKKTARNLAVALLALTATGAALGDDLEKALMEDPDKLVAASGATAATQDVYLRNGWLTVANPKVAIPTGEKDETTDQGFEALISANGQGLLVELGLAERDAEGNFVLNEDGSTKRKPLRKGMIVKKGDVLGKQKDSELVQDRIVAEQEWNVACQELAVAQKEAEKTLEIDVAKAAFDVAMASYNRAKQTAQKVEKAVSEEELHEKYYEAKRAQKSVEKAEFDKEVNGDKVEVAKARVAAADARINAAEVAIENRKLVSPIGGVVTDVMRNEGEWLREGDEILRVARYDKVKVKGVVPDDRYAPEMIDGKDALVTVFRPSGDGKFSIFKLTGKVVFVNEESKSGYYEFEADVANQTFKASNDKEYWALNPGGMSLVTIQIRVAANASEEPPAVEEPKVGGLL